MEHFFFGFVFTLPKPQQIDLSVIKVKVWFITLSKIDNNRIMALGTKTGGRQKGSPNKTTAEIRQFYQKLLSSNMELLQSDLDSLEPLQRIKILIELSKFVIPVLKATELNIEGPNNSNIISLGSGIAS